VIELVAGFPNHRFFSINTQNCDQGIIKFLKEKRRLFQLRKKSQFGAKSGWEIPVHFRAKPATGFDLSAKRSTRVSGFGAKHKEKAPKTCFFL